MLLSIFTQNKGPVNVDEVSLSDKKPAAKLESLCVSDKKPAAKHDPANVPSAPIRSTTSDAACPDSDFDFENPPKTFNDHGIPCTLRYRSNSALLFNCKHWRTFKCPRQVRLNALGQVVATGEHLPACFFKNGLQPPSSDEIAAMGHDYAHEMRAEVTKLAEETRIKADDIWQQVNHNFIKKGGQNYQGMRKHQVKKLVWHLRREQHGTDQVQKVEMEYGGTKREAFLRHSSVFADVQCMQRMMCFAFPELLKYLLYASVSCFDFYIIKPRIHFTSHIIFYKTHFCRSSFLWMPLSTVCQSCFTSA